MPTLENHIDRILGEARECLTPPEIADRLNSEPSGGNYTGAEIKGRLDKMRTVYAKGDKYCRKAEDASQAAARIVREATEE